ncbi:MAG: hypothetical protein ACFFHD_00555 [Promethearchaeota archaeon]
MQSIRKKLIIITIIIIILGISITIPIISSLLSKRIPRNYGELIIAFQVEERENSNKIIENLEFTLKVEYNPVERKQHNKHLEFIFELEEKWKEENYIVKRLWITDTVRDHYWVEKVDDNIILIMHSGIINDGVFLWSNGTCYNLTCWELGTGPDPRIGTHYY